jgi:peptidoglycan/LPS O-acetylase OafA/YrhL
MCIQILLLTFNSFDSMVTLSVYFKYVIFYVKHLLNTLWPCYKFIQFILSYFLRLLQIILLLLLLLLLYYIFLLPYNKQINLQHCLWLKFWNNIIFLHDDDDGGDINIW